MYSVLPIEPLIIEHLISMVTSSKTSITYQLLYIQEKPNILIKMDSALNFPCKMLLKNLVFLCQLGVWLVKSRYSAWTVCKGTVELAKDESCKIWDSRSLLMGCRLVFKNE